MKTATEVARENEQDDHRLDYYLRDFIKRYEPADDRLGFEMSLHHLVRLIYREAAKPYERALTSAATLQTSPFIVHKPSP